MYRNLLSSSLCLGGLCWKTDLYQIGILISYLLYGEGIHAF